ncbi:MAG: B12-binding domain-containing radical SAM protein, partial [Actinomycetota bacterium]|nr:B12-binding domain-containing radical SAM protein [Actinomycetota bacterium]
ARGGREVADVIEVAWRSGARFDAWTERFNLAIWRDAMTAADVDSAAIASRMRGSDERMAWDHLSAAVSRAYLWRERERAYRAETTPDCSFTGCTGCDACGELGVDLVVAGDARG